MAFIGTVEEYEEYQKTEKPADIIEGSGNKISYDDLPELSEEDARIIRQTRLHHVPYDVYMQSDSTFYDEHYNKTAEVDGIDEEFMNEIKSIRRIYKNYPQWCKAMNLRDEYLDMLIDKYGGEDTFLVYLQSGLVQEWIPPRPIYATNSPDYQAYLEGKLANINDWDDDSLRENIQLIREEFELNNCPTEDVGVQGSVLTNPLELKYSGTTDKKSMYRMGGSNNTFDGVSTNDLDELQRMVQSWITPDVPNKGKKKIAIDGMFGSTEESIASQYYTQPFVDAGGISNAMESGTVEEIEEDLNEMVIDEVTGRPMTRKELYKRQFVRFLSDSGWDELRVMRHFGVGSNFELKIMEQRNKISRTAKKKASSFMSDICGEDISTIDELANALFDD